MTILFCSFTDLLSCQDYIRSCGPLNNNVYYIISRACQITSVRAASIYSGSSLIRTPISRTLNNPSIINVKPTIECNINVVLQ